MYSTFEGERESLFTSHESCAAAMAIDDLEQVSLLLFGAAKESVLLILDKGPEWFECGLSGQEALRMHRLWRQLTCFLQQAGPMCVNGHASGLLRSLLGTQNNTQG